MKNGLYAAEFKTPLGQGNGVVILINGLLKGGDSMIYYEGSYTVDGNSFKSTVKTGAHAHPPGMTSVFGKDSVTISLSGSFTDTELSATGTAAEVPGVNLVVKLKLISAG